MVFLRKFGRSAALRWRKHSTTIHSKVSVPGNALLETIGNHPTSISKRWWAVLAVSSSFGISLATTVAPDDDLGGVQKEDWNSTKLWFDPMLPVVTSCEAAVVERTRTHDQKKDKASGSLQRKMTNVGRFSLVSETADNPSVAVLVVAMKGEPYKAKDFSRLYRDRRIAEKHPRFHAHLDDSRTHFSWEGATDRQDPIREMIFPGIPQAELKDRVNDAALYDPLDLGKTLWEAWTATGGAIGQSGVIPRTTQEHGVESLLLFRAHHCMADGVSLGALFTDLMDEGPQLRETIHEQIRLHKQKKKSIPWWKKILFALYYWIWGALKALFYQAYLLGASWYEQWMAENPWEILKKLHEETHKGDQTVAPRSLAWSSLTTVDEAKRVTDYYSKVYRKQTGKRSKITINDLLCSCVSAAVVKQLEYHKSVQPKLVSGKSLSLPFMNLITPVHLQGGILLPGQSMGNKIGAMVSRIPGDSLSNGLAKERLLAVHAVLNDRKQTPAAVLSYLMAGFLGKFSSASSTPPQTASSVGSPASSWTPWLFQRAHANASVVVTNVRGPPSKLHLEGRSVERILGFLPLPGGVPLGVVVSSYDQDIHLTLTAEDYAVPAPDRFLEWVQEEYERLKQGMEADEDHSLLENSF